MSATAVPAMSPALRRVALASFVGTTIEFFDFFIYGTAAGVAYALAAVVGGALPPVLAPVVQAAFGSAAVGAMLSGLGLLGVACGLALPETRDRSLRVPSTRPMLAEG